MGGHPAGQIASGLAVAAVEEFCRNGCEGCPSFPANAQPDIPKELEAAFRHAEARIVEEAAKHPDRRNLGTTLTMAWAVDGKLFVAHAGHSRCYLLSRGELRQLTQDHTVAAELVRLGALPPQDAARNPYRHTVTNVLEGNKPGVRVELHTADFHPNDVLLLCTDGLTEMVAAERIAAILRKEREPRRACERLVAEANERGGQKNVTVIVARVEPEG
jgi:protein phosphatase